MEGGDGTSAVGYRPDSRKKENNMAYTITRSAASVKTCLKAHRHQVDQTLKALAKRKRPITFEVSFDIPKDRRMSSPCEHGKLDDDATQNLAEIFAAIWTSLNAEEERPPQPKRRK